MGVPLYSWEDELSKCSAGTVCDHRNWAETYSAQLRSYPCQLDWGIQTLKKGAKFKLFKIFQFYLRFSSLLISRSYLIPTVSPQSQLYVQTFYIVNSSLNWIQVIESQRTIQKMTVSFNAYSIIFVCMISVIQTDS